MGRKPILTKEQELELSRSSSRRRLPAYFRVLRRCVYRYTKINNIPNPFREEMAGRYWFNRFMQINPQIRPRKAQNLNSARAQKLNKFIVNDHFTKLEEIMRAMNIIDKPERIYNIDEKGCRLCLHQQKVLARKDARRVHLVANEHGQNVSIVACGNAIGTAIPPMILFKGKRIKPEWGDSMPPGTSLLMTEKVSMTHTSFSRWIEHFLKCKVPGPCLVIFDGAKCHLDYSILETAERFNITLYCLPSNTTHELQPMDKSVFRAYEYYWDDQVVKYFSKYPDERSVSKMRFGGIFSTVWDKTMTPSNIKARFRATGIYFFNREAFPEVEFAPSSITNQDQGQESGQQQRNNVMSSTSREEVSSPGGPSTSGLQKKRRDTNSGDSSSDSDYYFSLHDESSDDLNYEEETAQDATSDHNISFIDMLITPDKAVTNVKRLRKPAINSRAQVITIDLFRRKDKNKTTSKANINRRAATSKTATPKTKIMKESWFCKLCREDRPVDMRLCSKCLDYVHEECVGLTKKDKIPMFLCPDFE
ncbi:hypothetical protein NQ314_016365 [Rhamnusium bicolor]|uniref:DDE-1 domain-containing protein n=1 Tax=Rhamnusium bicolor TaxID=1586634 RepID=A0AAV8WVR8_9CUCU|nr:hypothetical protein NQ314_016365 [Rhamnusium bicolor]